MGNKLDNQNGLTLLEVLLSIVILSIVLTSFASFFSQSAMFVKKNEEKLSTSQTSQKIVNLIELNITKSKLQTISDCADLKCTLNEDDLEFLSGQTINSTYSISAIFTPGEENLILAKVAIIDSDDPESSSETFTYIRR
ncbi:prepilin-type N-terminal cleavage/methylation domain-containing protein [Mesobacillus jeotgali]|uniref:Prepilin-type N-terminal cleavage/methylation domain-containing protein n=1 Tax=Mesobacillus jeotgali TaxID=129985 RepID=A0ABY9VG62_9BACI|nr:prepilin-type N-terminal cleavage/methylation domain-containing protein [Mesobacillus jeotgali]WNF21892.1 prepilin-type N-terminal cleavage/methylation domain-containing protein [Mesobacillus jeotgali]